MILRTLALAALTAALAVGLWWLAFTYLLDDLEHDVPPDIDAPALVPP